MTETSCCLDSHSKFFCTIGAFILAYWPIVSGRLFHGGGNFKDSSTYIGSLSVTFFCILQNVWQTHEAGTLKDGLTFSQVISLWVLYVQFTQHSIKKSRQKQFLSQMASKLHNEPLQSHLPFEVYWSCQEHMCLTVMKSPKFLKHFKCHIL